MRENEGPEARMDLLGQAGDAVDENRSQGENNDPAQQQTDENGNNGAADDNEDEAQSDFNEEEGDFPKVLGSKQLLAPYRAAAEHRRKNDKIYAIKPISLVEADQDYDYGALEDSLINFILEKVVVMREVPFVRAMEQLERNVNVNRIYDQISRVSNVGGFAGR